MDRLASPDLIEAMIGRRRQLWLRMSLGAAVALTLGDQLSWRATAVWLIVWCVLQLTESAWTRSAERSLARGGRVPTAPPLALVFLANAVFASLAVASILSGNTWLMVCGVWLAAGALLNAGASAGASTSLFVVGAAPALLASMTVLTVAAQARAAASEIAALAFSVILLMIAAFILRAVGARGLLAAKEASASKGEFLANVSHEIRTPLNGVLGMAQVMAAGDLPPEQRERLEVIIRSGRALASLLNDVLDLSKIEAGKLEIDSTDFDLERLALDLVQTFQHASADKDVVVRAVIEPSIAGYWQGDPARIRQVLTNLLSNAVKFTSQGEVRLHASATPVGVEFAVVDSGIGIRADRLAKVFDKYVQASAGTSGQYGGTGLGLSICRELVMRMGGQLTADSGVDVGSTFRVSLPLQRSSDGAGSVEVHAQAPVDFTKLKVLAAEDHPTNQAVLRLLLSQVGIEVHIVEDGQAAVEAWRHGAWDLILMDVQMPVLDGPGAALAIRDEERRAGRVPTPIIALTANAMKHQIEQYLACGMNGYVAKPLEFAQLLEAMATALEPHDATADVNGQAGLAAAS